MADAPAPRRSSFVARILLAMAAGGVLGQLAQVSGGPTAERIADGLPDALGPMVGAGWRSLGPLSTRLGELGTLVVDLIKGLAGPLLFFAVVDAFLRTRVKAGNAARMLGISAINACFAVVIGLTLSNLFQPGRSLAMTAEATSEEGAALSTFAVGDRPLDFLRDLLGFVPTNPVEPFLENTILSIVILAVLGGAALRKVKDEQLRTGRDDYRVIEAGVAVLYRAIEVALTWVIALIPLAVFGVVAKTVAEKGFTPFLGLFAYVGVAVLGLAIQVGLVYQGWLILVARMPLRRFWSGAKDAVVYALGASSSLATLPVTLRCLDRMGVSPTSARLSACVGTNFNNDGILLYEAMAVLFVAQAYGLDLTIGQQLIAALSCVVAGIGIAGVPEAGLISLALVLSTVKLPIGLLPLLLTVDWALSRCRAMTNVVSDILVAVLLDRTGVARESAERLDDATAPPEREAMDAERPPSSAR